MDIDFLGNSCSEAFVLVLKIDKNPTIQDLGVFRNRSKKTPMMTLMVG